MPFSRSARSSSFLHQLSASPGVAATRSRRSGFGRCSCPNARSACTDTSGLGRSINSNAHPGSTLPSSRTQKYQPVMPVSSMYLAMPCSIVCMTG